MKRSLLLRGLGLMVGALFLFCHALATTYYVSNSTANGMVSGNDTNNGTAIGTPFLTVDKAISVAVGGDIILVNNGTFAENSASAPGRLFLRGNFASTVLVTAYSMYTGVGGAANTDVVITGSSGNTGELYCSNGAALNNLQFKNVSFTMRGSTSSPGLVYINTSNASTNKNLTFTNCRFTLASTSSGSSGVPAAIYCTTDNGFDNLTLDGCTLVSQAGFNSYFMACSRFTGSGVVFNNWTIKNCSFSGRCAFSRNYFYGQNNLTVTGNSFYSDSTMTANQYAFVVGNDGTSDAGAVTNAYIAGNMFKSDLGHACLIGCGTTSATLEYNDIYGGNQGVVVKECTGVTVQHNRVQGLQNQAPNLLYNKASTSVQFLYNLVIAEYGLAFKEGPGDTSNKPLTTTVKQNRFIGYGSSTLLGWAAAASTNGGGVSNYNVYELHDSALMSATNAFRGGTVSSSGTDLAGNLKTAWLANGLTGETLNDSGSLNNGSLQTIRYTHTAAGANLYCILWDTLGRAWNGTSFETFDPTRLWRYRRWMVEDLVSSTSAAGATTWAGSQRYYRQFTFAGLPSGNYTVSIHSQAGNLPAVGDTKLSETVVAWNGASIIGTIEAARKVGG